VPLTREQLGALIIAAGDEARLAFNDAAWMRRNRHGDPTAMTEIGERACHRLGMAPAELAAALKEDPKLAALLAQTVSSALLDVEQAATAGRRLRLVLVVGLPLAIGVCVVAWIAYQSYADSPEVRARAAAHQQQTSPQPTPP
jgi:hypothetical protein